MISLFAIVAKKKILRYIKKEVHIAVADRSA
jgi:hypothetical protein